MTMNRAAEVATAASSTPTTTTVTTTKTNTTTTRSRCRCRLASKWALLQAPVPVLELRQCELGACEEIGGVRAVVDAWHVGARLRHHRPSRLAQRARDLHCVERTLDVVTHGAFEIGFEQTPILCRREAAVRPEVREIEHRGAESAVFPIDEPESIAVVDEVAGQQVVMAEDDR